MNIEQVADNQVKKIVEYKAGTIPFIIENGVILMQFMISSDPKFGGAKPQVCKGGIDPGEDAKSAAFREAHEELGLRFSNILDIAQPHSHTFHYKYHDPVSNTDVLLDSNITIYACQVASRKRVDFDKPHFETKYTIWWPLPTYELRGRTNQLQFVQYAHDYALKFLPSPLDRGQVS